MSPKALLRVRNLAVLIRSGDRLFKPLKGIDFDICVGETVGLFGESGAGKTTLALAILGLLPSLHFKVEGSIELDGVPLLTLPENQLRKIRGLRISLIYQDSSILNPVVKVGDQIVEVLRAHFDWSRRRYKFKALSLLQEVELEDPVRIYEAYPHQLSGGQRQRIAVAQALSCQPALVIADEPTASLDPTTTAAVLGLLGRMKHNSRTAFLIISHDLTILDGLADRTMIMYAGRIVEQGLWRDVMQKPHHPYTSALSACGLLPRVLRERETFKPRLPTIGGPPADTLEKTLGCDFEARCPDRQSICRAQVPQEVHLSQTHCVRCFKF